MGNKQRPAQRRKRVNDLEDRAVCRDKMSSERFEMLKEAETVQDLVKVFEPIFEPSSKD